MREKNAKKYQLWTYSDGGYGLKEFDTLDEALEEDKYGSAFYITKYVDFEVRERFDPELKEV